MSSVQIHQSKASEYAVFAGTVQASSLAALPLWYPFYRLTTMAKQEILYSSKPSDMSHLPKVPATNFKNMGNALNYYHGIKLAACMQPLYPVLLCWKKYVSERMVGNKPLTLYQDCALSGSLGVVSACFATPLGVILTQMFRNKDANALSVVKDLYQNQGGLKRFSHGLPAFAVRNGTFCIGLTAMYPKLQRTIATNYPQVARYKLDVLGAGLVTAFTCSAAVDFVDLVGVMRQSKIYKDKNMWTLLREVHVKHGFRGLFAGIAPKTFQSAIEIIVFNETFKYITSKFSTEKQIADIDALDHLSC
jgi:hypothetical protein